MNSTSTVFPLRRTNSGLLAAGLAVGLLAALPADARDRPGTPNNVKAYACGDALRDRPRVCVEFHNTASEKVRFETEVTRNGVPFPATELKMECLGRKELSDEEKAYYQRSYNPITGTFKVPPPQRLQPTHWCHAGHGLSGYRGTASETERRTGSGAGLDYVPPQGFIVQNLEPRVEYCFRFRARRVSDEVVSALWSSWACAAGRDLPPKPSPPANVSAEYFAASFKRNTPYPNRVVLKWLGARNAAYYTVHSQKYPNVEWAKDHIVKAHSDEKWRKEYRGGKVEYVDTVVVEPEVVAAGGNAVEFCAHNVVGTTCTRTVPSRLVDAKMTVPGRRTPAADAIRQSPVLEKTTQPRPAPVRPDVVLNATQTPKDLMRTQSAAAAASVLRDQPKVLQQPSRVQPPAPVPSPAIAPSVMAPQRASLAASVFRPAPAAIPVAPQAPAALRPNAAINGACQVGFVWREARLSDHVCVTPQSRARVANENLTAGSRLNPGGGAYGPNTCRPGYVWREAFAGDLVCVEPQIRTAVREENALASSRVLK
jgi:hypothetical protein